MGRKKMSTKEYRESIEDRYGEDFLEDFDAVFSGDITLSRIHKKHKISKMRATQIFKLLYGVSFRQAKRDGGATDLSGRYFSYEPGKTKQFMVKLPMELDDEITRQSKEAGRSKAAFIRECIIDYIGKDDPLANLARTFGN